MNENRANDERLLIDFHLGQCDSLAAERVQKRLAEDAEFRRLSDGLSNTLSALALAPEHDPPEGLLDRTLARIAQRHRLDGLLAREQTRRRKGWPTFSLRELGAIAAAVLVAAMIFIPSVRQARRVAMSNRCASNVGRIGTAMLAYANENAGFLPVVDGAYRRWLGDGGEQVASNSSALFKLVSVPNRYETPVIFQCPAVGGESFVVQAGMADFPAGRFVGYSYQHMLGRGMSLNSAALQSAVKDMAILADSTPLFEAGRFRRDRLDASAGDNHDGAGQNVLFTDGHVDWAEEPTVGVEGNNIFLAEGVFDYRGNEKPAGPTDTFLLPAYSRK